MIVIVAEKPDVGSKIAAALDKITLAGGKTVTFASLKANEKAVKSQQNKDGYLRISFMGQECYVTWGAGHLCELKHVRDYVPAYKSWSQIPLPFIPEKYEIQLRVGNDPKWADHLARQFGIVKKLINQASLVINATDADREGEVIFAYIYELAKCNKPVKRAWFSSMTQEGLQEAFAKLRDGKEMYDMEQAGRMRGIADWLVGANLTVAMSLKNPAQGVFSLGRVQTPTLNLCVSRELEIRNFKPEPYWTIEAVFTTPSGEQYKAKHHQEKILTHKEADAIIAQITGKSGVVTDIQTKRTFREVPLLYSLSALQMEANSKFGLTLSQTLEVAQKLYDSGYTTYPRTNSQYLTEDMEPAVNKALDALATVPGYASLINGRARKYDHKHFFDNKKVESHHAIVPTGKLPDKLSSYEAKIYDLICKSVIRMLYGPAELEQTKVTTNVNGEDFFTNGHTVVSPGWMAVGDSSKEELLPDLLKGDACSGEYKLNAKETKPPSRYNDKTLLAAMLSAGKTIDDAELRKLLSDPKTGGIGTEATRAAIVQTLEDREYISRNGKSIQATEKGITLIKKLPLESLKSAEMTARWEQRLNNIARGTEAPSAFQKDIEAMVGTWVAEINDKVAATAAPIGATKGVVSLGVNCPVCGKPMSVTKWGYGCSGWKDGCKFGIGTLCQKRITENQARILISSGKSPLIKGFVSKTGRKFDAFLVLDGANIKFEFPK